jgi:5-methyltetrahydropteroyltriglutamate--homocysteine methyltransferase
MVITSNLGFPRIGPNRELKKALEGYWAGKIDERSLQETARSIRRQSWLWQREAGIEHIPSNDFSFYDHVLDTSVMLGAVPSRFESDGKNVPLATYFAMARGDAQQNIPAMEMTKWFDTNYHYLVPELYPHQTFQLCSTKPIDEFLEARELGIHTRPVLLGPVSYLLLGKSREADFQPHSLLKAILPVYSKVLDGLAQAGADWVQFDEPCMAMDLDGMTHTVLAQAYQWLSSVSPKLSILLASYFGPLGNNLDTAIQLPVQGLHVDLVRGRGQLDEVLKKLPKGMSLSVGLVDGRNVWRTNLEEASKSLRCVVDTIGEERTIVGPSCSLLHVPVDLGLETVLDARICPWLAFGRQKLAEIVTLAKSVRGGDLHTEAELSQNASTMQDRRNSPLTRNPEVWQRIAAITPEMTRRQHPYNQRRQVQQKALSLPLFPTTTIGSFPQTPEIRAARSKFKRGELSQDQYDAFLQETLRATIRFQEEIGLDVLVHGEAERNDMVEFFGEQLDGFVFSGNGWVQSYGSRCVKPPIIYGDVRRKGPMTVRWAKEAMACTKKPVKGMLTGPNTILCWSFVRDDQPRSETCRQIALEIHDEVRDLEVAGVPVIQIDEPAFREGLPLREADHPEYLRWAVKSFRLASSGVADATQIHTHMCYSEFNHILGAVAALDADVISIETARSNMELLSAFRDHKYPNEIGPGVYDIHSPQVPTVESILALLTKALEVLRPEQLWVNPDCGLKTRTWAEVRPSLENMVVAARVMREQTALARQNG